MHFISFQPSPVGGPAVLQRCEHSDVNQKRFPGARMEIHSLREWGAESPSRSERGKTHFELSALSGRILP